MSSGRVSPESVYSMEARVIDETASYQNVHQVFGFLISGRIAALVSSGGLPKGVGGDRFDLGDAPFIAGHSMCTALIAFDCLSPK